MATPDQRKDVRTALAAAFGRARIGPFQPLVGGTSGASIYRFDVGARTYALRLEPERIALQNRQRHYACMSLASDAGAAPKVRFADAEAGVSIIDYIAGRPMAEHPAGPLGLMRALGALMMKVRAAGTFPDMGSYPELIGGLLAGLDASGQFPVGGLATHISGLARIQKALPWEASTLGPSHNDPNPRNILFDGERLWLIDWELAARNDPLTDVAILSNDLANSPESESALLEAAFGRPAEDRKSVV